MNKHICIHGHFYQPPRENPWLNAIEMQESAYPYHDWNDRITSECYARNTASRILDTDHKTIINIVNNYSKISFNFGPTLLSWLEAKQPEIYQAILEADKISQKQFSGHGAALAQVYNHIIMPLANTRDKRTQILWGIKDFEYRFGRFPEGMWLAETAVDTETLEIMAECGIKFTILAPRQAARVRKLDDGGRWKNVSHEKIDPKCPYLCKLPSGRTINIFVYDGSASQAVAFEGLLTNGEVFAKRLIDGLAKDTADPQLLHIATDGESYGHHHRFGDMALAYCLHHIEKLEDVKLTIYGEYLEKFPPAQEIEIVEKSSWSCVHGVDRWNSDCGCHTGGHADWNQEWRGPLRESLDFLRDRTAEPYENMMKEYHDEPWAVRNEYVEVILNRKEENVRAFLQRHFPEHGGEEAQVRIIKLLELQNNAQLMYTSCGWFFDEISGIEAVQVLKYAGRVVQLFKELSGEDLENSFLDILNRAKSNIPDCIDGAHIYNIFVKPSILDLLRVGAHFALASLFHKYKDEIKIYCYKIKTFNYKREEAGKRTLAFGKAEVRSTITYEKKPFHFIVLHLGDHNLIGGVREISSDEEFEKIYKDIEKYFHKSDVPDIIRVIDKHFENNTYSLWHLFKDEQQKVLKEVLQSTMEEIESSFRQIYEHHYPLIQVRQDTPTTLPKALSTVVEFTLNRDLIDLLQGEDIDIERLEKIVAEIKRWNFDRDRPTIMYVATQKINQLMQAFSQHLNDIEYVKKIKSIIQCISGLEVDLDLWKTQNIYYAISKDGAVEKRKQSSGDPAAQEWVDEFQDLGQLLQIKIK